MNLAKLVCATATALLLVACGLGKSEIEVAVRNSGTTAITNIELRFTGGTVSTPIVSAGEHKSLRFNPKAESHLIVRFSDASGQTHETAVNVYFESGSKGTIELTIDQEGKVDWKANISPH